MAKQIEGAFISFQFDRIDTFPYVDPKTGQEIPISARRVVTFRASHKLKERVEQNAGLRAKVKERAKLNAGSGG